MNNMKKIFRVKRYKNYDLLKNRSFYIDLKKINYINYNKTAAVLKNIMYNRKEILFFSLIGVVRTRKGNSLNKSVIFVGNMSRSTIKYHFDAYYPGIKLF